MCTAHSSLGPYQLGINATLFYKGGNLGTERLSHLPEVTQQASSKAQVTPCPVLLLLSLSPLCAAVGAHAVPVPDWLCGHCCEPTLWGRHQVQGLSKKALELITGVSF